MDIHAKLKLLGLELPEAPKPVAAYVPAVRSGNLIYVSGQGPLKGAKVSITGPVPSKVSFDQAQEAARLCMLNALSIVNDLIGGDWTQFVRVVHVRAFVHSDSNFTEQHLVANGASNLLAELFGEAGRHARAALGTNSLPLGIPVEVELVVEVRS